jgi:hypothetical protein
MFCAIFIIKTISTSTWECTPDGIYGMLNKWKKWKKVVLFYDVVDISEYTVLSGKVIGK